MWEGDHVGEGGTIVSCVGRRSCGRRWNDSIVCGNAIHRDPVLGSVSQ